MAKRTGGFIGQDGINAPDPATGVTGTAGNTQVTVSWTAPSDVGGAAITGYVISSNPSVPIEPPSLATASYTSKSFSLASQGTYNYYAMTFNGDGTKAYFTGFGPDAILQYSLSTAWDISTASYDSVSLDVSGQTDAGQSGLVFSPDGSKLYMVSYGTDTVYQYALTTPFDLSTGSYASKSLSISSQDSNPQDMYIKSDGTKLYVLGDTNNSVFQYSMSTPFDLATASYDSVSFVTTSQQTNPTGLFFSPDGTTMLICGYSPVQADKYTLSTPWVVSSASHISSFTLSEFGSDSPNAIFAGNDLNNLFVGGTSGSGNGVVYQYAVGMPTGSPFVYGGLTNGTSYTFNVWAINPFGWSTASDASGSVSPATPPNGLFQLETTIESINISTTGNAADFGDKTTSVHHCGACGSSTRGIFGGGESTTNIIDFVTFASAGNATDFGDLTVARESLGGCNSDTRGIFSMGGSTQNTTDVRIDYITMASAGNATDFGDPSLQRAATSAASSPTRGVFGGGFAYSGSNRTATIDYITISSTGNAQNFGTLTTGRNSLTACSNNTRAVFAAGRSSSSHYTNIIDYVTIASTGNATDFGDLITSTRENGACSSPTRGVFGGGAADNTIMEYITLGSTGNAIDFGDLALGASNTGVAGCSAINGGLS